MEFNPKKEFEIKLAKAKPYYPGRELLIWLIEHENLLNTEYADILYSFLKFAIIEGMDDTQYCKAVTEELIRFENR